MTGTKSRQRRQVISRRKKTIFAAVVLLITTPPILFMGEVVYRYQNSIPLTGGRLYEGDLRISEDDLKTTGAHLRRFRKSENSVLFYEPRPGHDKNGFYAINSHGFRDHEYTIEKSPETFRVVALGDSIIWGAGLPLEQTFSKQLESLLNERFSRRFEVLNFGVAGYCTQQEVELYRVKASQYDPDLVIVGYCLNDYLEHSEEADVFRQLYYDIFSRSYLWESLETLYSGAVYDAYGTATVNPDIQVDLRKQFELLEDYSQNRERLLVIFPELLSFQNYLVEFEHDRARAAVDGLDYDVLDLLSEFQMYDAESVILNPEDRTHPNAFGTRIAAQATLKHLMQQSLIPPE